MIEEDATTMEIRLRNNVRLRVPRPDAHPAPNWIGKSAQKITYDKGNCKILYMNDQAHGNVLNPEMCERMHYWLSVRFYESARSLDNREMLTRVAAL